jgi:hypothetical protein
MSIIPFDDIVPGASVRVAELDGMQYLSIRDVIMCVCEKDYKSASKVWERMPEDFKEEISPFCRYLQFPGAGQKEQPIITFKGALKLLMVLPGENAKSHRTAMAGILQRYYAGDGSLVEEIKANATSANPIAQLARGSLVETAVVPMDGVQTVGTSSGLETLMVVDAKVDVVDGKVDKISAATVETNDELRKMGDEIHFCHVKMQKQTAAIAHLNATIRAKDAELRAKDEDLRAKDEELVKLQINYAALKALEEAVSSMASKLDSAMQIFF